MRLYEYIHRTTIRKEWEAGIFHIHDSEFIFTDDTQDRILNLHLCVSVSWQLWQILLIKVVIVGRQVEIWPIRPFIFHHDSVCLLSLSLPPFLSERDRSLQVWSGADEGGMNFFLFPGHNLSID